MIMLIKKNYNVKQKCYRCTLVENENKIVHFNKNENAKRLQKQTGSAVEISGIANDILTPVKHEAYSRVQFETTEN